MSIDINCDLGEENSAARDMQKIEFLLHHISTCNIACGFHAGDPLTIQKTIQLALKNKVAIGAHPSYPDRKNFGRRSMKLSMEALQSVLAYQISALYGLVRLNGGKLNHVKLHGALYHDVANSTSYSEVFISVIKSIDKKLKIIGPPNSSLGKLLKENNLTFIREGFIDRVYTADVKLKSRSSENAVIHDPILALEQLINIHFNGSVNCEDGVDRTLEVDTFCIHGDHENTISILGKISQFLEKENISLAAN